MSVLTSKFYREILLKGTWAANTSILHLSFQYIAWFIFWNLLTVLYRKFPKKKSSRCCTQNHNRCGTSGCYNRSAQRTKNHWFRNLCMVVTLDVKSTFNLMERYTACLKTFLSGWISLSGFRLLKWLHDEGMSVNTHPFKNTTHKMKTTTSQLK